MEIIKYETPVFSQAKELQLDYFTDPDWRSRLGRIVLITGSYDLLTPHHMQFIRRCKNLEPGLTAVLALDSDEYIRRRKGELRPIVPYDARRDSLAELECIDWIIRHEGDNCELISTVRPQIFTMSYATAQEQPEDRVEDVEAVCAVGGRVIAIPGEVSYLIGDQTRLSTSGIIDEIVRRYGEPIITV